MLETKDPKDYERTAKIVHRIAKHTALPDVVEPMTETHRVELSEMLCGFMGFFEDEKVANRYYTFNNGDDLKSIVIVIRYLLALGVSEEDICEIIVTTRTPRQNLTDMNDIRLTASACMDRYRLSAYIEDSVRLKEDRIQAMKGLLVICCQAFIVYQVKPLYKRILSWDVRSAIIHHEHNLINDPRLDSFCEKIMEVKIKNPYKVTTVYKKYYAQLQNFKFKHTLTSGYITNPRLKEENKQELQRILVKIFEAAIVCIKSFETSYKKLREEHIYYSERYSYKAYEDMSIAELLLELMRVNTYQLEDYLKRLFLIITLGEKLGLDFIDWYLGHNVEIKAIEEEEGWSI